VNRRTTSFTSTRATAVRIPEAFAMRRSGVRIPSAPPAGNPVRPAHTRRPGRGSLVVIPTPPPFVYPRRRAVRDRRRPDLPRRVSGFRGTSVRHSTAADEHRDARRAEDEDEAEQRRVEEPGRHAAEAGEVGHERQHRAGRNGDGEPRDGTVQQARAQPGSTRRRPRRGAARPLRRCRSCRRGRPGGTRSAPPRAWWTPGRRSSGCRPPRPAASSSRPRGARPRRRCRPTCRVAVVGPPPAGRRRC
jgi:hypothetical protein